MFNRFFLSLIMLGCGADATVSKEVESVDLTPKVRTEIAQLQSFSQDFQVQGVLYAIESAVLIPRSVGRIKTVHVRIGDKVAEGDLLLQVDTQDYEEGLKEAEAAHRLALTQLKQAQSNLNRYRTLSKKGVATLSQLEKVQVATKLANEQVNRAAAGVAVAKSRVNGATLKAPFDGIVIARNVERGEMIGGARPNPPLMIADIRSLRVVGSIRESAVDGLKVGDAVEVFPQTSGSESFSATIDRINGAVDPVVRTVEFEALVDNPNERLKHGMSATIRIQNIERDAVSIPRSALLDRDSGNAKIMVLENNIIKEQFIQYGQSSTDRVPIFTGLKEGEKVVVAGHTRLTNGDKVKEVELD